MVVGGLDFCVDGKVGLEARGDVTGDGVPELFLDDCVESSLSLRSGSRPIGTADRYCFAGFPVKGSLGWSAWVQKLPVKPCWCQTRHAHPLLEVQA